MHNYITSLNELILFLYKPISVDCGVENQGASASFGRVGTRGMLQAILKGILVTWRFVTRSSFLSVSSWILVPGPSFLSVLFLDPRS
jgi:hypothetical protein